MTKKRILSAVEGGITNWAREVGVLLDACWQLVEYYGTDEEGESFQLSVDAPRYLLGALTQIADGREAETSNTPPFARFVCTEVMAAMLSPLLRIVVEWEPDFVADAREQLDEKARQRILIPYGQFVGTVGTYLCDPIWMAFPRLAPPGWPM